MGNETKEIKNESIKKHYWAAAIIIRKSPLAGMPKVAPSTMVLDKHPLLHELEVRDSGVVFQWQNWIEIPKDIYDAYFSEMRKNAGESKILQAIGASNNLKRK